MDEPRLKRSKLNPEEERLTELSSCKMSLTTKHEYLQVESLNNREIKVCAYDDKLITKLYKKWENKFPKPEQKGPYILIIKEQGTVPTTKDDEHEEMKMKMIRLLAEDGFKIINTVFDPTRGPKGAEKHMMHKEFHQPTNQSCTDKASENK